MAPTVLHDRADPREQLIGNREVAYRGGVDEVFRALADPTRRLLLEELRRRDGQTLFELCTRLISVHGVAVTRQAVSKHLGVLADAGLVHVTRAGRTTVHRLDPGPFAGVAGWLDAMSAPAAPTEESP
ncbi:helix-turn-helix transcriptional regulator [Cellulomonas sp. IC4_254]|nr:helix-turn-helix domain-containing protein [Cellulomonas sp. IC4_254]NHT17609.1 helix-turn-helix transcriptional regulator [Cellulomonas sp. IC4_254]